MKYIIKLCNLIFGLYILPTVGTSPGIQCYQCDQVDSLLECSNRVTCADGEVNELCKQKVKAM